MMLEDDQSLPSPELVGLERGSAVEEERNRILHKER